jgi:hypothetical protein
MKKNCFLIFILAAIIFASCTSTSSGARSSKKDTRLYVYTNPSTEYNEREIISFSLTSDLVIFSVNRDESLMMMEIGTYSVTDGIITINAGKFQARGTITEEKIVIEGKEFLRD